MDLTESHAIADHAHSAVKIFGRVDVLVNNAGEWLVGVVMSVVLTQVSVLGVV